MTQMVWRAQHSCVSGLNDVCACACPVPCDERVSFVWQQLRRVERALRCGDFKREILRSDLSKNMQQHFRMRTKMKIKETCGCLWCVTSTACRDAPGRNR